MGNTNTTDTCHNMAEFQHHTKQREPDSRSVDCTTAFIQSFGKDKSDLQEQKADQCLSGLGRGEGARKMHERT